MKRPTAMVCIGLFVAGAAGCSSAPSSSVAAAPAFAPVKPVAAVQPAPQPLPPRDPYLIATGPVTEEQQLDVVALRAGAITSLSADIDTRVQRNQILARLDDRELQDDRAAAEHKYQSLQSDLKNWQAEVQMRSADLKRAEQMREAGINTPEDLEHVRYNLTATQFEVERQREEMLAADAAVKSLDQELEKTHITAPFSGIVSQRFVRDGEYVAVGQKLFHLVGSSPLEVRFTIPGQQAGIVHRGQTVTISPTPDFAEPLTAVIRSISPVIDPGSGMLEVIAVLDHPSGKIMPGMIATVRVPLPR
ncbi:MAG TPA: efflux RND transporter periplasmic adaptor subunit [Acidobacteriaceae bacterium]|jgi:RND family efflux transporter MFP subunit